MRKNPLRLISLRLADAQNHARDLCVLQVSNCDHKVIETVVGRRIATAAEEQGLLPEG